MDQSGDPRRWMEHKDTEETWRSWQATWEAHPEGERETEHRRTGTGTEKGRN